MHRDFATVALRSAANAARTESRHLRPAPPRRDDYRRRHHEKRSAIAGAAVPAAAPTIAEPARAATLGHGDHEGIRAKSGRSDRHRLGAEGGRGERETREDESFEHQKFLP